MSNQCSLQDEQECALLAISSLQCEDAFDLPQKGQQTFCGVVIREPLKALANSHASPTSRDRDTRFVPVQKNFHNDLQRHKLYLHLSCGKKHIETESPTFS
jgi:hypothetical protein